MNTWRCLGLALPLISCSSATVTLRNESRMPLQGLRLSARCYSKEIRELRPGRSIRFRVSPCDGESAVRLQFIADGVAHDSGEIGYIESSWLSEETLRVRPDLTVDLGVD